MRYIYVIRNLVNGKVYVGQTVEPKRRWQGHLRSAIRRPLYSSMRKHGVDNFSFEVLEECADELINEREQHWIAHFDSFNPEKGYNLTLGGENNPMSNPETRAKVSKSKTGKRGWAKGRSMPDSQKNAIRKAKLGQSLTEEHRAKIRGKVRTSEQRMLISLRTKMGMTPEVRQKISQRLIGRAPPNKGKSSPLKGKKRTQISVELRTEIHKLHTMKFSVRKISVLTNFSNRSMISEIIEGKR